MGHISIRDLQKLSGEAITSLPGPTPVKVGDRTVAMLVPLRGTDVKRLEAVLKRAEKNAKGRNAKADEAALAKLGDVDISDWSIDAVKKFFAQGS